MIDYTSQPKDNNFFINKHSLQAIFGIPGVVFYDSVISDNLILLSARLKDKTAKCICCGKRSKSVHSSYMRKLTDLAVVGRAVKIILKVRKFRCRYSNCTQTVFSEQHLPLTRKHSRLTDRTSHFLQKLLIEVSSRKGEYISELLSIKQSSSTCLRIVKSIEMPHFQELTTIGIDDWAYRKGKSYGTIIVNAINHRPVELLKSRDKEEVADWLIRHNSILYVTRDRSSSYSNAIKSGASKASQIADRFHLVKNLGDHIAHEIRMEYKTIKNSWLAHRKSLYKSKKNNSCLSSGDNENTSDSQYNKHTNSVNHRKQELFNRIHELKNNNYSQRAIAKALNISRNTVRYYFEMEELLPRATIYYNNYGDFMDLIKECCNQGLNVRNIFVSLKKQGFKGNQTSFYQWFNRHFPEYQNKKRLPVALNTSPIVYEETRFSGMSPNRLAIHLTNSEWGVSKETGECSKSHILAEDIINSSMLLKSMREVYNTFREVLNSKDELRLDQWLEKYKSTQIRRIKSFINGIIHDLEAVKNAIKYPWSNGVVEGHVNRLKNKKREMYGRAGFELLRRKVVLSNLG